MNTVGLIQVINSAINNAVNEYPEITHFEIKAALDYCSEMARIQWTDLVDQDYDNFQRQKQQQ